MADDYSNLDATWIGLSSPQVAYLLQSPTYCCRLAEGCQDTQEVGLQHWQEEAKDRLSLASVTWFVD